MAGNAMSILRAVYLALPAEFKLLQRGEISTGESGEMLLDKSVYGSLDFVDFARSVLAAETRPDGVNSRRSRGLWSDLGDCEESASRRWRWRLRIRRGQPIGRFAEARSASGEAATWRSAGPACDLAGRHPMRDRANTASPSRKRGVADLWQAGRRTLPS